MRVLFAWFFSSKQSFFRVSSILCLSSIMPIDFFIVTQHQVSYLDGSLECFNRATVSSSPFQRDGKRLSQVLHKTPSAFLNLGMLSTSSSSFSLLTHNTLRSIRNWESILMLLKERTKINKNIEENCSYCHLYFH